nr:unnamed protein product [Spirometra erinaceieuropaei]
MDVDLNKVVLAHSYGLALNVKPINNVNISIVYSSKSVCASGTANSYWTMIIVKSALTNYVRRLQLREVIRQQAAKLGVKVGVLFSLGLPANGQIPLDLLKEVAQFDDILLANYTDTYHNLTLKTISNLRFVHHNCLHKSSFFVFLDDDQGINLKQLRRFFSNVSPREVRKSVFGLINYNKPVIRNPKHKWFTSMTDYPFPHYPDYPFYDATFMHVIDDLTQFIVIIMRERLSSNETLLDMLALGEPLLEKDHDLPPKERFMAHGGMVRVARAVSEKNLREGWVKKTRISRPHHRLVMCGHGRGAGQVSFMSVLLRIQYPEIKPMHLSQLVI